MTKPKPSQYLLPIPPEAHTFQPGARMSFLTSAAKFQQTVKELFIEEQLQKGHTKEQAESKWQKESETILRNIYGEDYDLIYCE